MARRDAAVVVAIGLAVVAIGVLVEWRPFLTEKRAVVTATPSLSGLFNRTDVPVGPGQRACISPVPISHTTATAQLALTTLTSPRPQPLVIIAEGDGGYRSRAVATSYPVGPASVFGVAIRPPRRDVVGRVCVRNAGRRRIALTGTAEQRSLTQATTTVDGRRQPADVALTFLEAEPRSLLERTGTVLDRAAAFTGVVPAWLLWPLVVLLAVGVPLAVFWGLYAALRADEP
ncbi:MAG TPA: hypothetical protein VGJ70_22885, partial [Solirubrobacteraceae bacterium]